MADCRLQIVGGWCRSSQSICNPICILQSEICIVWISTSFSASSGRRRWARSSAPTSGWRAAYHPDINPGDRTRRAAVPPDRRSLRDAERSGSAPALRRRRAATSGGPRRTSTVRVRGLRLLGQRERAVGVHVRRSVRRLCVQRGVRAGRNRRRARGRSASRRSRISFEEAVRGGQRR